MFSIDQTAIDGIDAAVRQAAYRIIAGKGATCYGIGAALAMLARCILFDQNRILTVSCHWPQVGAVRDVTLSLPVVVGSEGAAMRIAPALDKGESAALEHSATLIKQTLTALGY